MSNTSCSEREMTNDKQSEKKELILEYLKRFPFYKWAAAYAGISKDTLEDWRKADIEFSARCESAKAEALEKLGRRATPDFMLKSADPESFKDRVDLTSDGEKLEGLVIIKDGSSTK